MIIEDMIIAAKVGGSAAFGSALALKSFPGNKLQKFLSFLGSMGIGCMVGGFASERFAIPAGSWTQLLIVSSASVFGLAIVHHAMLQIPEWMAAARKKFLEE